MKFGFVVLLAALVLLAGAPAASDQQSRQAFTAKTTLLTLDVTALDRDGAPVAGLKPDDFEIKVNGSVQPVEARVLDAAGAPAASPGPPAPLPPGVSARRSVANVAPPEHARVFVIVVDDLSFEPGAGKALFVSAQAFVSRLPPADFVGFALTSGSRSISPTADRRVVLEALRTTVGSFSNPAQFTDAPIISIGEALEMEDDGTNSKTKEVMLRECFDTRTNSTVSSLSIEILRASSPCADNVALRAKRVIQQIKANRTRQLQALQSILDSVRRVSGIKHVVLLSNGVPITRDVGDFLPVARAAARAGVGISTMVQEGDIDLSDTSSSVELPGGGATRYNRMLWIG